MEIWKDIEGYEGLYQVSNLGRVKSLERYIYDTIGRKQYVKERILKQYTVKGYKQVSLLFSNKHKRKMVHRLVAEAFLPNPNNLPQVNHKDECKTNNYVENLEWCDASYNINYGTRNQKISKVVLQFTKEGDLIAIYPSTREAERQTQILHSAISACCKGRLKTSGKYVWKYG